MDENLKQWIERSLEGVNFGEVVLIIHNGEVVRIDRKERKQIDK